jgi:hypothetical protein
VKHDTEQKLVGSDRSWISALRRSPAFILAGLIGAGIVWGLDLIDKAYKVFGKSDAIVLAENSDRSRFSDAMVRKAYTRLFLADLIARRVQDEAPPQYIVAAWKEYVQSVKEWNADLMINISGMANFYDDQKGLYLETVIQPDLIATDSAVRKVALAPI